VVVYSFPQECIRWLAMLQYHRHKLLHLIPDIPLFIPCFIGVWTHHRKPHKLGTYERCGRMHFSVSVWYAHAYVRSRSDSVSFPLLVRKQKTRTSTVITATNSKTLTLLPFLSFSSEFREASFYVLTNSPDDGCHCLAIQRHRVPKIVGFSYRKSVVSRS
jgi:hypothetical protein